MLNQMEKKEHHNCFMEGMEEMEDDIKESVSRIESYFNIKVNDLYIEMLRKFKPLVFAYIIGHPSVTEKILKETLTSVREIELKMGYTSTEYAKLCYDEFFVIDFDNEVKVPEWISANMMKLREIYRDVYEIPISNN